MDYPPNLLQELYEQLPKDLQDAIFSEEVADKLSDICSRNGIKDEDDIWDIAKYTGYVLIGILPPNELAETLKKELKLSDDLSKQVSWEISRFIFLPLENNLEALYKIEIEQIKPKVAIPIGGEVPFQSQKEKTEIEKQEDTYREPIE